MLLNHPTLQMNYKELIEIAKTASLEAGEAILEIYHAEDRGIELKSDDSPLTLADKKAHAVIVKHLDKTGIAVLSEEGSKIPFEERKNWEAFWMVDPLDGTKEFIKRNGEFTVNIALIENGKAMLGVVYVPVQEKLYWGNVHEEKAYMSHNDEVRELAHKSSRDIQWEVSKGHQATNSKNADAEVKIVCSRSHMNEDTLAFVKQFSGTTEVPMGSSLKFLKIAEGEADIYPRFGPTMEWDTAAAHGVISACGYHIKESENYTELRYNKENLLNPFFVAF